MTIDDENLTVTYLIKFVNNNLNLNNLNLSQNLSLVKKYLTKNYTLRE